LRGASSTARELHVTLCGLNFISLTASPGSVIDVYTDSQVSVAVMGGSGRAPALRALSLSLLLWQRSSSLVVRPAWLPREILAFQDSLSRSTPFAESTLTPDVLEALCQWAWHGMRPTLDAFSSPSNAVCARFVTAVPTDGCADVDGLRVVPRDGDRVWCFPPFGMAARAADHYACGPASSTVWVGPLRLGVHLGRPHALLHGPVLSVPPTFVHCESLVPLVAVLFSLTRA
jgi:hypothetical protein